MLAATGNPLLSPRWAGVAGLPAPTLPQPQPAGGFWVADGASLQDGAAFRWVMELEARAQQLQERFLILLALHRRVRDTAPSTAVVLEPVLVSLLSVVDELVAERLPRLQAVVASAGMAGGLQQSRALLLPLLQQPLAAAAQPVPSFDGAFAAPVAADGGFSSQVQELELEVTLLEEAAGAVAGAARAARAAEQAMRQAEAACGLEVQAVEGLAISPLLRTVSRAAIALGAPFGGASGRLAVGGVPASPGASLRLAPSPYASFPPQAASPVGSPRWLAASGSTPRLPSPRLPSPRPGVPARPLGPAAAAAQAEVAMAAGASMRTRSLSPVQAAAPGGPVVPGQGLGLPAPHQLLGSPRLVPLDGSPVLFSPRRSRSNSPAPTFRSPLAGGGAVPRPPSPRLAPPHRTMPPEGMVVRMSSSPAGLPSQLSSPTGVPGQLSSPAGVPGQLLSPAGMAGQLPSPAGMPGQLLSPALPGQLSLRATAPSGPAPAPVVAEAPVPPAPPLLQQLHTWAYGSPTASARQGVGSSTHPGKQDPLEAPSASASPGGSFDSEVAGSVTLFATPFGWAGGGPDPSARAKRGSMLKKEAALGAAERLVISTAPQVLARNYLPDLGDPLDVSFSWYLLSLDQAAKQQLKIRRLVNGQYEIDGRRVALRFSPQGPPSNAGPAAMARGCLLAVDLDEVTRVEVPFESYLAQVTANMKHRERHEPLFRVAPGHPDPQAAHRLTFHVVDELPVPFHGKPSERHQAMMQACEQARLRAAHSGSPSALIDISRLNR